MKRHTKSLISLIRQHAPPHSGAEIGVWTGHNALAVVHEFPAMQKLYGVDDYRGCPNGHISGKEAEEAANKLLDQYGIYYLLRMTSKQAAEKVFNVSLDFVFIDASHDYESVKADIALWAPKVRKGGLIAGHDYGRRHKGVIRAVDEASGGKAQLAPGKVWWVIKE